MSGTMERILRLMGEKKASDVYLSAHAPALIKINGQCVPINNQLLPPDAPKALLAEVLPEKRMEELEETGELNMAHAIEGVGNFRFSAMRQRGTYAAVIRFITTEIPPLEGLAVPLILGDLIMEKRGLLLMVGSTGAGKSTTLAAMMDYRNERVPGHILTIEDPVEKKIAPRKSIITQREVGYDVLSFADGMREALRMSPDVLLTSEIRDAETAEQAIQGGESGSLMIATTHGKSVTGTMRKILSYTGTSADVMRSVLAGNLIAVIRQALVPSRDGKRYLMAADVLFNTGKVTQYIERGDWIGLESAIREDNRLGASEWVPMNNRLVELVRRGEIEPVEAMRETSDIPTLKRKLAAAGTAVIGR